MGTELGTAMGGLSGVDDRRETWRVVCDRGRTLSSVSGGDDPAAFAEAASLKLL